MRNCSRLKRQQIPRMIASTWPFPTSMMFPQSDCSRAENTSLRVSWCRWRYRNMARHHWCLLIEVLKWTALTTVTIRARWQRPATWHSSTVGQPFHLSTRWCTSTSVEADSCLPNRERAGVHRARELATEQPRPQSGRLLHLGSTATTCLSTEIRDLDHLKAVLTSCWEHINQELIDKAINQRLDRISLVIWAKGWHIEQHLRLMRLPCNMSEKHSFRWLQNLGYFRLLLRHFTYAYLFAYFS